MTSKPNQALVFFAEGFEEVEATTLVDLLRRAEIPTQMVSITSQKEVTGSHGITLTTDALIEEIDLAQASLLLLPGGMPGAKHLSESVKLNNLLIQANQQNRWIGAICAAPLVLGRLGLLKGRNATCYPGFETELSGAHILKQTTVTDGNIVTSKGVVTAIEFALTLIAHLEGEQTAHKVKNALFA